LRVGVLAGIAACATPSAQFDRNAQELGFSSRVIAGAEFSHVVYQRRFHESPSRLHVYLEGDGSPRIASRYRPPDPTPKAALMLRLLALDASPSLLLGRPCQHAVAPCDPFYWTLGRYNEKVVESLAAALQSVRTELGSPDVVLIGYSGGGALAMLIAERIPETRAVVTIAGNLDTESWALHHGYTRLSGSLDPAQRAPLDPEILQIHLVAEQDERVPPALTQHAIARQPGARRHLLAESDHTCCWESAWPALLDELERELLR
jgi:hypothetical protein